MKKTILAIMLSTLALTACHDDDDDHHSPGNGGNPPPTTQQGIFTDSPIENADYLTSLSDTKKTTTQSDEFDEKGKFDYENGETIQFSIGNIQIGEEITAKPRITPMDLYGDQTEDTDTNNDYKLQEALIVFLQALDEDGIHENGIQISDALKDRINEIYPETTTFESIVEPDETGNYLDSVEGLLTEIDAPQTEVDVDTAAENIQNSFYNEIAGTWELSNDNFEKVILIVNTDGSYKLGTAGNPDENEGVSGYEFGNLGWTWKGQALNPTIDDPEQNDTNGSWGLSDGTKYTLTFDGTNLILTVTDSQGNEEIQTFNRVEDSTTQDEAIPEIVGTWEVDDTHILTLLKDETYFLIDTTGGDECGPAGIEYGTYSAGEENEGTITFAVNSNYNTNEDCGFNNEQADFSINGDELTLTVGTESPTTFTRATYGREIEPTPTL